MSSPLEAILTATRARPCGPGRWMGHCPAHHDRTPSLSIRLAPDGVILLRCFGGCPTEEVIGALGLGWGDLFPTGDRGSFLHLPPPRVLPQGDGKPPLGRWQKWWEGATPGHPLLQRYLHARGLCIPPPPSLRLALWGDTPVMLARITGPRGDLVGLHLTTLEPGGRARKEKRLAAGSKPLGGAIRLFPLEEGQPLALAEGIETALAVHQATGWPAWATVSASFMPYVHIPPEVREVVICPDNDPPGLEAGRRLARRLPGEGRKVRLAVPPIPGADWLDLLKQAKTPGLPAGGGEQGGR